MNILRNLSSWWKSMDTAGKINAVLDIVCGIGGAAAGNKIGAKLCEGSGRLESICIRTFTAGTCLTMAEAGSKALGNSYGRTLATVIDAANGKKAQPAPKPMAEEEEDEDDE